MKTKTLVLLFGIILFFQVVFASNALEITEFTSSTKKTGEGNAVDFRVTIKGIKTSLLEFEWDFGDGFKALTSENTISHAFYLEGLEKEKEFTVKVRVKDKEKILSEKSLKIVIERSEFKPWLLQPAPLPEYAEEKDSIHSISLLFLDAFGQEIPIKKIIDLNAKINKEKIDLNWSEKGFFIGSIHSTNSFHSIEKIEIEAEIQGMQKKKFSLPLFFKPLKITTENPFKKEYYFNSLIDRIAFHLSLPDGSIPKKGKFTAMLLSSEKILVIKKLFFENKEWITGLDYRVSKNDLKKGLELIVFGLDEFGNKLEKNSFMVPLKESSPEFEIVLIKPFTEKNGVLGFGQLVEFTARVNSTKPDLLENIKIWMESSDSRIKTELVRDKESFKTRIRMPENGNKELLLSLTGSAEIKGKKLYSLKEFKVMLSRKIGIEFVYPVKGTTVKEKEQLLKVRLSYPNNENLNKESVNALLFVDGKQFNLLLLQDKEKALYFSEIPVELIGRHELRIELLEPFNGTAEISTNIVKPIDWFFVLGIVFIVVLIAFTAFTAFSRAKNKKKEKILLKAKINEIDRELKKAEGDYYKRKLTDNEYREKVLKLQQEKEIIIKKIKTKKKD